MPRISSLPASTRCAGFKILDNRSSSSAADNGSAAGRWIELWHRGSSVDEASSRVAAELAASFPLANLDDVLPIVETYAKDPRNLAGGEYGDVIPELCEAEVRFEIPASDDDPTGEPIVVKGHPDQVRRTYSGALRVWDTKFGKPEGNTMVFNYAMQLAAYAVGLTELLGEPVAPGGIIRLQGYRWSNRCKWPKDDPSQAHVFFRWPATLEQAKTLLTNVADDVAQMRRGVIATRPGDHCRYCPSEPHLCNDQIVSVLNRRMREQQETAK